MDTNNQSPVFLDATFNGSRVEPARTKLNEDQRLRKACQDFESIFIAYLFKSMRATIPKSGFLDEGLSGELFRSMLDQELASQIAGREKMGLSELMYRQLSDQVRTKPEEAVVREYVKIDHSRESSLEPILKRIVKYNGIIEAAAKKHRVEPNLIKAVIAQESGGRADLVSSQGAMGLMQLMNETAKEIEVRNPFDPEQNIFGGTKYLKWLLERHQGNLPLALASYNAGPGAVDRYRGIPPFKETKEYVRNVLNYFQNLNQASD